jgi:hypothetical protein
MTMAKKISPQSTKNELFEAYNELLEKIQNEKPEQPRQVKEKEEKENLVKKAAENSAEALVKNIADLKLTLNSYLEKVEESLLGEYKKLVQLQEAIKAEKNHLEELYQITANADSLSAMILAQKEKKVQFEKEMEEVRSSFEQEREEKKKDWEKEKVDHQVQTKEEEALLQKKRKREEEEYNYNLLLARKKDKDVYEQKKAEQEKELAERKLDFEKEIEEREKKIGISEKELLMLREKTESFPTELEIALKQAVKETSDRLQKDFKFDSQLRDKETAGVIALKDQIIDTLQSKIKGLELNLQQSSQKVETSEKSVKDIAIKAIESSSNYRILEKSKDNKEDQR